ncbi:hypothetical protein JTB14_019879 [Gonioctena quinquepunctata]|nr:hypothetical protein JTB14_019879 [Gonioctena quinquepunctata]
MAGISLKVDLHMHTMDDKKGPRFGGSKVSEIANIFQAMTPVQKEDVITPLRKTQRLNHSSEKIDADTPAVTVMRTESHVTRFNNARAMFEKLGEEHKKDKVFPLQSTRSASNILDSRSRTSSANSETRDTKSQHGSRSPSPPENILDNHSNSVPMLNSGTKKINGFAETETNGKNSKNDDRTKPALMKKPEKPERKFNSKELIERQRNWTSHFSKTRTSRYNSDPNKNEVRLAVNTSAREAEESPTSPPPPPIRTEASRRPNPVRKERPASVIPTTDIGSFEAPHVRSNSTQVKNESDHKSQRSSLVLNSPDNEMNPAIPEIPKENTKSASSKHIASREASEDYEDSAETLSVSSQNVVVKSPLGGEDKENSRENLSVASGGSLSSLSPPSSPSKVKSEQEKQEQEGNEKSVLGECFYF